MTIKLLATYKQYKPGTIVTLDSALEAFFVSQKNATLDLTGGTPYVEPTVPDQELPVRALISSMGVLKAFRGADGSQFLVVSPVAPSNADGRPDGTIYIQAPA